MDICGSVVDVNIDPILNEDSKRCTFKGARANGACLWIFGRGMRGLHLSCRSPSNAIGRQMPCCLLDAACLLYLSKYRSTVWYDSCSIASIFTP